MPTPKQKYYVVWQGREAGIYHSWDDCRAQTAGFAGAKYKSFASLEEAQQAFAQTWQQHYQQTPPAFAKKTTAQPTNAATDRRPIRHSWAVDAACSGNPGLMEYRGVDTATGEQLFYQKFVLGTNNIGEFLAIVHALAHLVKHNDPRPIYSDSKIALGWVRKKKAATKLVQHPKTALLHQLIARAEQWLEQNPHYPNQLLKWETELWGEIPADFGRK